jgi:hypothetical protein
MKKTTACPVCGKLCANEEGARSHSKENRWNLRSLRIRQRNI